MTIAKNTLEGSAEPFLKRVENVLDELASERGTYMARAKDLREDIKSIYTEAKDKGIAVPALKALVKERELQKKIAALGDGLDIDAASQFKQLADALGGPLGEYAKRRASEAEDNRDLRPRNLRENDKTREDADNLAKVGRGPDAVDSLAKH
jgi:uncharacterized protein (UPF0335 family)